MAGPDARVGRPDLVRGRQRRRDAQPVLLAGPDQPAQHGRDADRVRPRRHPRRRRARPRVAPGAARRAAPARRAQRAGQHPAPGPRPAGLRRHCPAVPAARGQRPPLHLRGLGPDDAADTRRHPLHLLAGLRRGGGGGPDLHPARAGQRPAQAPRERRGLGRRRQRRLPAHHGEPVHPAASRPRREDPHAAGVRRHQGGLDVVPAHDGARPVHQQRVEALVAQPAQRQRRPRGLPRRAGSVGGHRRSDRRVEALARPELLDRVAAAALPGAGAHDRGQRLALRLPHPRRRLRQRRGTDAAELHGQGVHPRPQPDRAAHAAARAAVDP